MIKFELMGTDSIITWTEGGVEMTTQSDVASDRRVVQVLDGRVLCVPARPLLVWFLQVVGDVYVFFWPTALTNLQCMFHILLEGLDTDIQYSATVVVGPSRLSSYVRI